MVDKHLTFMDFHLLPRIAKDSILHLHMDVCPFAALSKLLLRIHKNRVLLSSQESGAAHLFSVKYISSYFSFW